MHKGFRRLFSFSSLGLLAIAACDARSVLAPDAPTAVRTARTRNHHDPVRLGVVTFTPNRQMVIAAVAHVECAGAITAVQVSYNSPDADEGSTPRLAVSSCPVDVDVLGLLPSTRYHTHITAWGQNDDRSVVVGPIITTTALPSSLPQITTQVLGRSAVGLTALAAATGVIPGYSLVVDSVGKVRWYRVDSSASNLEIQPQPHGHYTVTRVIPTSGPQFDEIDIAGSFLRRWIAVGRGIPTDAHEIRLTPRGTGVLLGLETRTIDLSSYGGSSAARVTGNVLEEVDSTGGTPFLWRAFDHFSITDVDPSIALTSPTVDWTHGNAIDIDDDGNYLVSFRHFSEITKIDSRTGVIIWRWGGVKNEFRFIGDTLEFAFQHGIRRLANGNFVLFDNGNTHTPHFSRAVEYRLDEQAKTATLVWSYRPSPDMFSGFFGLVQRLQNGNTLVTFGPQGILHEVTPSGQLVWKLTLPGKEIYRARRIRSLYDPRLVDESPTP